MSARKNLPNAKREGIRPVEGVDRYAYICAPILSRGDVNGAIMYITGDGSAEPTEVQTKLIQTAAALLGKQIED